MTHRFRSPSKTFLLHFSIYILNKNNFPFWQLIIIQLKRLILDLKVDSNVPSLVTALNQTVKINHISISPTALPKIIIIRNKRNSFSLKKCKLWCASPYCLLHKISLDWKIRTISFCLIVAFSFLLGYSNRNLTIKKWIYNSSLSLWRTLEWILFKQRVCSCKR